MNKEFYIKNRKKLASVIEDDSLVIMMAGQAPRKSGDENYEFVPNRNFLYLTGDDEEKDILVMLKSSKMLITLETMFIRPIDEMKAKWVGATYTPEYVKETSGCNVSFLEEFEETIAMYINRMGVKNVYLDLEKQGFDELNTYPIEFAKVIKDKYPSVVVKDVYPLVAELRMVKEDCEIEEMRKAIHITNLGLQSVLKQIKSAINESQLANKFAYTIFENGANDFAFHTIAAGGINSCTLHYSSNNTDLEDDCVVLFDLGAEQNYYKSDISRTYPHNGKFSEKQKLVYSIVLECQKLVESTAKPGLTTRDLNNVVIKFFAKKLKEIGLIQDDREVGKYYFHGVSHHIGLDTHDACIAKPLEAGMVISNEPGLYIPEWKIGVRIEDDLLITKKGCECLSKEIIKEIEDIENFIANN